MLVDEICDSCGAVRSEHKPGPNGPLTCPPRADGKIPVVVGHDIVGMDYANHRAVTRPRIEWQDPPRPPYIPTIAAHLVRKAPAACKDCGISIHDHNYDMAEDRVICP